MSEPAPSARPGSETLPERPLLFKKLAIWAIFLALLYLARDFFFAAFMTFLFSYLTLTLVGFAMARLSPGRDRPTLRRLLTIAVFVLTPVLLLGVGLLIAPPMIERGQHLAGWLSQVRPEAEVARLLENFVGPSEFHAQFGSATDPRYQKGLDEFRKSGVQHVNAYFEFPKIEAWVEGGFSKQFDDAAQGRIRSTLNKEGTSSAEFKTWFLTLKVPELKDEAKKPAAEKGNHAATGMPALVREAAMATPEELLRQAQRDPAALAVLRQEWLDAFSAKALTQLKQGPSYLEQFRQAYDKERTQRPDFVPYTFDQFLTLQKARAQGRQAFGESLEQMHPSAEGKQDAQLKSDFEAAKSHELFVEWWGTSTVAKFVRNRLETGVSGEGVVARVEAMLSTLLNIPIDLGTALLLSFFICIDFPTLRHAMRGLRETWLRDVYDEMAPALANLGLLIGRAMFAQGLIALCNATLMFFALTALGVEHAALLAGAVFVFCLVPTLGILISWVLIAGVALIQPGGGFGLVLKITGAVAVVVLLETFVFSPRILGRMMEVHPVLIIALLPIAQYFFGIWGLILATPVAVYVIHVLIFQRGLPGSEPESFVGEGSTR